MSSNDLSLSGNLPPYFMSNITIEKRFSLAWADLSLKGAVNNLFDEEYLSVLSRPMPGINFEFFVGITPKWGKKVKSRSLLAAGYCFGEDSIPKFSIFYGDTLQIGEYLQRWYTAL
jgi:hypothetical protein